MKQFHNIIIAISLATLSTLAGTAVADDIERSLVQKIERAKQSLARSEQRILRERNSVAGRLRDLEEEVLVLREKTAVARRKMDEKTLSLGQIESRLKSWQEQQQFQENLLNRFLKQQGYSNQQLAVLSLSDKIDHAGTISNRMHDRLAPSWNEQKVVRRDGTIANLPTLSVGPATWFLDGDNASIAHRGADGYLKAQYALSGAESEEIGGLAHLNLGKVVFDPTLGRALNVQQSSESLFEHIAKGGLWAVPILLFALIATATALFKGWQLWRLPKVATVVNAADVERQRAVIDTHNSMQKNLLDTARASRSTRERDDRLFVLLQENKTQLERWLTIITVTASVSPLLGLLGTVSGMIETFRMMTTFGSSDPEVVSGGIAQALVTTELGLVVAIPALVLGAVLSRRARRYYRELESFALVLSGDEREPSSIDQFAGAPV